MSLKLILNDVSVQIGAAFFPGQVSASDSMFAKMAHAATAAIGTAADQLKSQGRANIGAAGFSSKWQNAYRVQVYPKRGDSIDAAVWAFHKISYSSIFETGGTIGAKGGLLWIPLENVPKAGRKTQATPKQLSASGVKLFTLKRPGRKPLLATDVRLSGAQASAPVASLKLTLTKLRNGSKGKRGEVRAVPLFFGVKSVTIRKHFELERIATAIQGRLGDFYFANLQA